MPTLTFKTTKENREKVKSFQERLLNLLSQRSLQHIHLIGWEALTDETFSKLIENSPDLQSITIQNAPQFTCSKATWGKLSRLCPKLTKMHIPALQDMPLTEWVGYVGFSTPIIFESLKELRLQDAPLTSFQIHAPQLKLLSLKRCPNLKELKLDSHPIQALKLQECPQLTDQGISHDKQEAYLEEVMIYKCPELKFQENYRKYPYLIGQLEKYYRPQTLQEMCETLHSFELQPHEKKEVGSFVAQGLNQARKSRDQELIKIEKALLRALRDKDFSVRWSAAQALGELAKALPPEKGLELVAPLLEALKDKDEYVRQSAAQALGSVIEMFSFKKSLEFHLERFQKLRKNPPPTLSNSPSKPLGDLSLESPKLKEELEEKSLPPVTPEGPLWYGDEELAGLLKFQLAIEEENCPVSLWARATGAKELFDRLEYVTPAEGDELAISLIPIFLSAQENDFHEREGNHWALLILANLPQKEGPPLRVACYQNPMGQAMPGSVRELLEGWRVYDLQVKQQTNDNDCGPWVVYTAQNVVELLQGEEPLSQEALREGVRPLGSEQGKELRRFYSGFFANN